MYSTNQARSLKQRRQILRFAEEYSAERNSEIEIAVSSGGKFNGDHNNNSMQSVKTSAEDTTNAKYPSKQSLRKQRATIDCQVNASQAVKSNHQAVKSNHVSICADNGEKGSVKKRDILEPNSSSASGARSASAGERQDSNSAQVDIKCLATKKETNTASKIESQANLNQEESDNNPNSGSNQENDTVPKIIGAENEKAKKRPPRKPLYLLLQEQYEKVFD